jgi:hypothetical protein
MLEIEHCYSGFMGYPYVAWVWHGNTIVVVLSELVMDVTKF